MNNEKTVECKSSRDDSDQFHSPPSPPPKKKMRGGDNGHCLPRNIFTNTNKNMHLQCIVVTFITTLVSIKHLKDVYNRKSIHSLPNKFCFTLILGLAQIIITAFSN